jgi:hypothetical protein
MCTTSVAFLFVAFPLTPIKISVYIHLFACMKKFKNAEQIFINSDMG